MGYREVTVLEIKEALLHWLDGAGKKLIARRQSVDPRTVCQYVGAAEKTVLVRAAGKGRADRRSARRIVARRRPPTARGDAARRGHRTVRGPAARRPLPWTKMRRVYALLGMTKRYDDARIEDACALALAAEMVDVHRLERMVKLGLPKTSEPAPPPASNVIPLGRFLHPTSASSATAGRRRIRCQRQRPPARRR